jgi:hypothetical protein
MAVMAQEDLLVPMVPQVQLVLPVLLAVQQTLVHKVFKEQLVLSVRLVRLVHKEFKVPLDSKVRLVQLVRRARLV